MRLFTVLRTSMLLVPLSISAQVQRPSKPANVVHYFPEASGCPIAMRARQGVGGGLSDAKDGSHAQAFGARLLLGLNDGHVESAPQMLTAKVIVHGLTGKERILPLTDSADKSAVIVRAFHVNLTAGEEPGRSGELRLPGFTATRFVELESVTYSDGSTWKFSGQSVCRAVPEMLMRVATQ